jgi:predicted  nucleic acid-binding Zn-ribbon protein
MFAAIDFAALTTFTGPVVVLAGVLFLALRYNREETGKIVTQQSSVLDDMNSVYERQKELLKHAEDERDAARRERDETKAERDALRREVAGAREANEALRCEVELARREVASLRADIAEYERRRGGDK